MNSIAAWEDPFIRKSLLVLGCVFGLPLLLIVCKGVYNLYFHPLSGYPGPPAWSFTEIPNISARIRGKSYILFVDMHKKYGPVVRTGPNELSYIDSSIWNDVYAHRAGRTELPKQPNLKKKYEDWSLFDHPVAAEHTRIRKTLRLAFTEKAMREQEPRIMRLVDCLIERLTEEGRKGEVDIAKWYTLATFDIMGDLTFGEDFQGLEEGRYHRWVAIIMSIAKAIIILGESQRFWPLDKIMAMLFTSKEVQETRKWHSQFAVKQLAKRIELQDARPDFMTYALTHLGKENGITKNELEKTCETLVIAGSDTSSTLLSGATFYLLHNPAVYSKLKVEVRSAYKSDSEIDMTNVNSLSYLLAVLNESLRAHPPVSGTHFRTTRAGGATVAGRFVPAGTHVGFAHWAAYHSEANWHRANEFVPERWLKEGETEFAHDDRKCFQPFSVGPRNCIGMNLAHAEVRVILAKMVFNFDMELVDPEEDWMADREVRLIMAKKDLMVRIKPAQGSVASSGEKK